MPNDSSTRPNIVFFMMDQLSAKWLEGDMAAACPTPNIDWLRSNGVTFSSCLSSNPVCCPARATMATGLTTRGHGVLQNGYELDPALPTFMQSLQGAGWQTAAYGKIHFHSHFHGVHPDYRPFGFDQVTPPWPLSGPQAYLSCSTMAQTKSISWTVSPKPKSAMPH